MLERSHEVAWAAGLIDGEGCVAILRTEAKVFGHKCVNARHRLILKVTMCDRRPIDELRRIFGVGGFTTMGPSAHASQSYTWLCNLDAAVHVLRQVRPFLVVKAEEADVAFAFAALPFKKRGKARVPPEEMLERERLFELMRSFKTRTKFRRTVLEVP